MSKENAINRDRQIAGVNAQQQQAQGTLASARPAINRVSAVDPNTGTTALRRALTNSANATTSKAYSNALVASRGRGLAAGLQDQPMQAGNELAIEGQRASALGQIPNQVEQTAAPLELQAAGLLNQQAGLETGIANTGLGAASQYDPNAPLNTAANLEANRVQQEQQANAQRSGLWMGLANLGLTAAAPFTGGATTLLKKKPK